MKKHEIFFGAEGITSTQANTVANWAKEMYQDVAVTLQNIQFYTESLKLLDSKGDKFILAEGTTTTDFSSMLEYKAQLQSLIAWLREAIKAKEALQKEVCNLSSSEVAEILGMEMPVEPERDPVLTEDDYIGLLNIKERNRYYYLESLLASYGDFIHPSGKYSQERKKLSEIIQKPNKVQGTGKDTLINCYTPSVSIEKVDQSFFAMQQKHRGYQAELNGMKHKMELAVEVSKSASDQKFQKEYALYATALGELANAIEVYKNNKLLEIRNSKIVIPNDLADIYHKVLSVGKEGQ